MNACGAYVLVIEAIALCAALFVACLMGSGTDQKNLRNYASYPDEVQLRIQAIPAYQGRFRKTAWWASWMANFLLFAVVLFVLGLALRESHAVHNFLALLLLGETLNVFDLVVVDLLWWRNTTRIRLSEIPEKSLYQNPRKHLEAFLRAAVMFFLVALVDGYLLALF